MNPFAMFLLAIFSPLLLAITLLVPPYAGILGASYFIYMKSDAKTHPLDGKLDDVFYILDVYHNLLSQWLKHMSEMSVFGYSLPLLIPPVVGVVLAFWLTGKLARKLMDIFQLGVRG